MTKLCFKELYTLEIQKLKDIGSNLPSSIYHPKINPVNCAISVNNSQDLGQNLLGPPHPKTFFDAPSAKSSSSSTILSKNSPPSLTSESSSNTKVKEEKRKEIRVGSPS